MVKDNQHDSTKETGGIHISETFKLLCRFPAAVKPVVTHTSRCSIKRRFEAVFGSWDAVLREHLGPGGSLAHAMTIGLAREGGVE